MDWVAAVFNLAGVMLQIYKIRWTFIAFMVSNVLWGVIGVTNQLWGMVAIQVIFFLMGVWGFIKWTLDGKVQNQSQEGVWIEFDLDGILFVEQERITCSEDYKESYPFMEMIKLLDDFKKAGYKIRIHTARWKDDEAVTKKMLDHYNIQYDELRLGKPKYVLKIDDRCWNPRVHKSREFLEDTLGMDAGDLEETMSLRYNRLIEMFGGK